MHTLDHDPTDQKPRTTTPPGRLNVGQVRWILRRSVVPEWLREILQDPNVCLQNSRPFIADSPLITLARVQPSEPDAHPLCLRRLNYGLARHRWRDVFRRTRAERAFWHGLAFEKAGVNTPRAWAAGVQRFCGLPLRGYLVTEWIEGAVTLEEIVRRERRLGRSEVAALARLLARMHNAGYSHRDLKSSNVLFDRDRNPVLIDLDGVRRFRSAVHSRPVADLARFAWEFAKHPIMLKWSGSRFLKRYCEERRLALNREAQHRLSREIFRPTAQRLEAGIDYWKP